MTIHVLAVSVLALALIVWICYRQLTWRPLDTRRMMRTPILVGAAGVVMLATTTDQHALTATDIALLVLEAVLAFGIGALMGLLAVFRPMDPEGVRRYAERREARAASRGQRGNALSPAGQDIIDRETRTGWLGLALWAVLIAVRVGVDAWAESLGSHLLTSTGIILVVIALNRVARVVVLNYRLGRLPQPQNAAA